MDTFDMALMELDDAAFLSDADASLSEDARMAPFRMPSVALTCTQGAFSYASVALASRAERILFAAITTAQLGVGVCSDLDPTSINEAVQYPTFELAVKSFLGEPE
ncbi:MAG TPA: hypothetical protein VII36_03315, partial [Usitatibacter sp.]